MACILFDCAYPLQWQPVSACRIQPAVKTLQHVIEISRLAFNRRQRRFKLANPVPARHASHSTVEISEICLKKFTYLKAGLLLEYI